MFICFQACKGEDLGKVEFDEEIKKRFKMVYVPNWFSVDLKTGVSDISLDVRDVFLFVAFILLFFFQIDAHYHFG